MDVRPTRIFPLGDNAVTIEFGNQVSLELNDAAVSLADHFSDNPFPGFIEAVPAIASTTIFYDSQKVSARTAHSTAYAAVAALAAESIEKIRARLPAEARSIEIPVIFGPIESPDIDNVAAWAGLSVDDVIDIFLSSAYRVFMMGFLPGFAYMGIVDERIGMPRLGTPRLRVPRGSVGIAGRQTGIYPAESPGGWQIIGRTELELFDPAAHPPCLLQAGDEVRFVRQK